MRIHRALQHNRVVIHSTSCSKNTVEPIIEVTPLAFYKRVILFTNYWNQFQSKTLPLLNRFSQKITDSLNPSWLDIEVLIQKKAFLSKVNFMVLALKSKLRTFNVNKPDPKTFSAIHTLSLEIEKLLLKEIK